MFRAYYLTLVAETSCCLSSPSLPIHTLVLNSKVPAAEKEEMRDPPAGWSPITAMPKAFVNIAPYMYMPSNLLELRNQDGEVVAGMMQEMPYNSSDNLHLHR